MSDPESSPPTVPPATVPPALEATSEVLRSPDPVPKPARGRKELQIFASTFFTIFLAEIGDKTQLTTLLLSAQSHQPWIVFAGASLALIATSGLGVWLGCWLSKRVSPRTLERSAAVLLLLIAAGLLWDIAQG